MTKKDIINKLKKEKYRIATYAIGAGIISATVLGIKYSNPDKNTKVEAIIKEYNYYGELKYEDVKNLSIIKVFNTSLNKNKYYLVKDIDNEYINAFDSSVKFTKNDENNVISINKIGILNDFIITYDYFNEYYTEEELNSFLNKITKDLQKNKKELVYKN